MPMPLHMPRTGHFQPRSAASVTTLTSTAVSPAAAASSLTRAAPGAGRAFASSGRVPVGPAFLLAALNRDLAIIPECAGLSLGVREWNLLPFSEGSCNWSETSLVLNVAGPVASGGFDWMRRVVAGVRERHDVLISQPRLTQVRGLLTEATARAKRNRIGGGELALESASC